MKRLVILNQFEAGLKFLVTNSEEFDKFDGVIINSGTDDPTEKAEQIEATNFIWENEGCGPLRHSWEDKVETLLGTHKVILIYFIN